MSDELTKVLLNSISQYLNGNTADKLSQYAKFDGLDAKLNSILEIGLWLKIYEIMKF